MSSTPSPDPIKTGLVFPGQGAQAIGMGQDLFNEFALARQTFEEASDAAGVNLAQLCFDDPDDQLGLTEFTQPCVLTVSLAAWRVLGAETGFKPAIAAGHSLGEYSALAAAGVIELGDAVRAVRLRGRRMQAAVPAGEGAMAAALGATREQVEAACEQAAEGQVLAPANDNAPGQIVFSGHATAVERAIELIKENGRKVRVRRLNVSGPFHTQLMAPAASAMAEHFQELAFSSFNFPVIANVDALPYPGPESAPDRLTRQLTAPVRWRETVERMGQMGVVRFIECGPGTVLAGLIKRILDSPPVYPMCGPDHAPAIKEALADG